jgi:hypothetical protein
MVGRNDKQLQPHLAICLEDFVPASNFYRHLEANLDLHLIRDLVAEHYSARGCPSIDPVVFFKLQLIPPLPNSSEKPCGWPRGVESRLCKWLANWASPTPPSTSGARNWPLMQTGPFRGVDIRPRRREELRRLKRELEVTRQERDILKKL